MGMSLKDPIGSTLSFSLRFPKPGEGEELGTISCLAVDLGCKHLSTDSWDTLGHGGSRQNLQPLSRMMMGSQGDAQATW